MDKRKRVGKDKVSCNERQYKHDLPLLEYR